MENKNISRKINEAGATGDVHVYVYKNKFINLHLNINATDIRMSEKYLIDSVRFPADWELIGIGFQE